MGGRLSGSACACRIGDLLGLFTGPEAQPFSLSRCAIWHFGVARAGGGVRGGRRPPGRPGSAGERGFARAPSASVSRSRRRAPTSGTMSSPWAATQAMATWAALSARASATARRGVDEAPGSARRFSPWKRGQWARKSPGRRPLRRPVAADQAARQHAVGGDADAELAAGSAGRRPRCRARSAQYSICRSAIGMDGGGPADGLRADLRQADVADVAGLHQLGDGADRVLDRHVRVEAGRAVDVDVVHAQPLQACRPGRSSPRPGRASKPQPGAGGPALGAELHADAPASSRGASFSASPISISLWPMP